MYAAVQIALAGYVFANHLAFPLNLEFMESTVLQHVVRLSTGKPIYVDPEPGFVALAYNPLFYVICIPFVRWLGPTLAAIRIPAMLGAVGAAWMIWLFIHRFTKSSWWAGIGVGIFAASYRAMDCYVDIGHRDSLLLLAILAGFWFVNRGGRFDGLLGMLAFAAAFWLKQTGVYFIVLGICYSFWQYRWPRAFAAAAVGLALGPLLHLAAPAAWFGPRLHYFTFEVPAQWTEFRWEEAANLVRLLAWHFGALTLAAGWLWLSGWRKKRGSLGVLRVMIPGALASGAAVMMTAGSSNNVYIPMEGLVIVGGVTGLALLSRAGAQGRRAALALLAFTFAPIAYDPRTVLRPGAAPLYLEFVAALRSLDGPVWAPGLGVFYASPGSPEVRLSPQVHVVPMADMVRGPGRDESAHPLVRNLLRTVESPAGPVAYILSHSTLEDEPTLGYLSSRYRLEKDFGARFEPLSTLPARHGHLYPRYLYRYVPDRRAPGSTTLGDIR